MWLVVLPYFEDSFRESAFRYNAILGNYMTFGSYDFGDNKKSPDILHTSSQRTLNKKLIRQIIFVRVLLALVHVIHSFVVHTSLFCLK